MNSRPFLFRRRSRNTPRKHRAYAVGDVHGCLSLLDRLLEAIEAEIARDTPRKASIVFLGDLIDRGPHSAQVVERLRTYRPPGASAHFIMGNHEEVMLKVLEGDVELLASWLRFGGKETLQSYGLDAAQLAGEPDAAMIDRIRAAVPASHRNFLGGFADSISFGDYLFVHAGIRPGIDIAEQAQSDLRWIRDPFLQDERDHGTLVVHGHTISREVDVASNRIGIDTGAYNSGTLTALALDGRRRWLVQTGKDGIHRNELSEIHNDSFG
ncbi:serine/threonine protein phosphatase [Sphingomonas sabuli]|uniref:Serine/threonine protein phosphatase n=1 Tax=Sphingomonas sabuli TaxID=2764186 RepID=A0A7G9L3J1_9SPHN|nr:metallophosphoesterase family protein [Sphingomonas sabuli]QNM83190.1 serine/threonine protein phosphatase [Sphingomonas sabuli]